MTWWLPAGDMEGTFGRGLRAFDIERVLVTGAAEGVELTAIVEEVGVVAESSVYIDGALDSDVDALPKVK